MKTSRTPMQWSDEANAGFTSGEFPWRLMDSEYKKGVNVAFQQADQNSLWMHYRDLINLRSQHAALRVGKQFK